MTVQKGGWDYFQAAVGTDSEGNDTKTAKIDGLAASQKRVIATTYSSTTIYAVKVLVKGTGDLTLSPLSGDTDIVIAAAELTAMNTATEMYSQIWYGPFDSITAGTGMEVLAYIA